MTGEEWDTHYWRILEDLRSQGEPEIFAEVTAERETTEQFGERPPDKETKHA